MLPGCLHSQDAANTFKVSSAADAACVQVAFSAHTRHPNIVQLLDVFADKERRTLIIVVHGLCC
jgi:hypothetical protein